MKRVMALTVTLVVASSGAAFAGQSSQTVSLADVARAEEARRKTARKATMVFTNATLTAEDGSTPMPTAGTTTPGSSETPTAGAPSINIPGGEPEPVVEEGEKKDQKYWQGRIGTARSELSRMQMFAESMQTRLNVLAADIVNLDYPARGAAEQQRNSALAELERLKKEIEQKTKEIAAIEIEARRAGVPVGWLRPPV